MQRSIYILVLNIMTVCCNAQSYMFKGKVTDAATDENLLGASVRSVLNQAYGTQTGAHGEFELFMTLDDSIVVSFIGYEQKKISARSISNFHVDVKLKAMFNTIEVVEINEQRIIAEEFSVHKFGKLDIYTNPSAKADPLLAVNSTASATSIDESANISLRGGDPSETGIFLNHVPVNDAIRYSQLNGIGTFSIFNTALLKNVQVYPGNPPLEFGNSTSGIIALETVETISKKSSNSVSLTLASTGVYSSRKLSKNASLTLFANYQPFNLIRRVNYHALKNIKTFSASDIGIHSYAKLKHNFTIKIFNYTLSEGYQFHFLQPTYEGIFHQKKFRNLTIGNFRKRIGKTELNYSQGINFSNADYDYGTTDIKLRLKDLFSSFNIHHIDTLAEWKTGISFNHQAANFRGFFPTFDFASGVDHPVSYTTSDKYINNPEWYGYYKRYFGDRLIAGGGLRKNICFKGPDNYISVQGNLHYKLRDAWKINVAAGKYHKYQLPQGEPSNAFLIRSDQVSIDTDYSKTYTQCTFSLFYKTSVLQGKSTNIKGIELFTRYRINSNVRFQFSFTSLNAKETKHRAIIPSPYNIHYFIKGNFEYKFGDTWALNTVFLFRQGSYYYLVQGANYNDWLNVYEPIYHKKPVRLPGYNSIELSLSKIFTPTEKIYCIAFLSAHNIFDFKNVRSYTYNFDYTIQKEYLFSQRTIYFGLIINF